ncbi:hypothetical protein F751_2489 [Auxenochlorella protothecoides]|uniref:Uncharacterized protein n=1 Tax=Auxenochlorella protothecoides TaxID=3075 RepID=A0A087SIU3_AUXPR|nr:hypothetical protein F751_2489 [Auxenochlorella protothecoides]KFM25647.1 hypothetical protein F751_2489 [Auxenochlorella protothecoides]
MPSLSWILAFTLSARWRVPGWWPVQCRKDWRLTVRLQNCDTHKAGKMLA